MKLPFFTRKPERGGPAPLEDPSGVRFVLIILAVGFLGLFLVLPMLAVFIQAFSQGPGEYFRSIQDPNTLDAIRLTLLVTAIAVPLNAVFGIAAAWALARFEFHGRDFLISLIDLPFAVSPVVSGLIYVLIFGLQGWFGLWLKEHDIQIIFAVPGVVLATIFVTFPFVAREVVPLMVAQGAEEEEAAMTLGARGWTILRKVTIPNIRWSLLYGLIHCAARAMGEFGAVSVVSGHVRGETNTIPLHVEILYNEYNFTAAFAVASMLVLVGLATLLLKRWLETRTRQQIELDAAPETVATENVE